MRALFVSGTGASLPRPVLAMPLGSSAEGRWGTPAAAAALSVCACCRGRAAPAGCCPPSPLAALLPGAAAKAWRRACRPKAADPASLACACCAESCW